MQDDQSYGDSHLGEILMMNSMYPLPPSLLHSSVQHVYKPDDQLPPAPRKFQGVLWLQIYIKKVRGFFQKTLNLLQML